MSLLKIKKKEEPKPKIMSTENIIDNSIDAQEYLFEKYQDEWLKDDFIADNDFDNKMVDLALTPWCSGTMLNKFDLIYGNKK